MLISLDFNDMRTDYKLFFPMKKNIFIWTLIELLKKKTLIQCFFSGVNKSYISEICISFAQLNGAINFNCYRILLFLLI